MDLYCKMGEELRSLFIDLFDPTHSHVAEKKIAKIVSLACKIGGKIEKEAKALETDVHLFLKNRQDKKQIAIMKAHALKLEEETREL